MKPVDVSEYRLARKEPLRARPGYVDLPHANKRRAERTELADWMEKTGILAGDLAIKMGVATSTIRLWAAGKAVPGLVHAYRLEQLTEFKVAVVSWLHTTLARKLWEGLEKAGRL